MNTAKNKLAKIASTGDDKACAEALAKFINDSAERMPLPGENEEFDKAMWLASEHLPLSDKDESILNRVTAKLLGEEVDVAAAAVLKLKDPSAAPKKRQSRPGKTCSPQCPGSKWFQPALCEVSEHSWFRSEPSNVKLIMPISRSTWVDDASSRKMSPAYTT